ncbi:hypothetical protein RRG08_007609 [Elysia crispata]|uniref:Uncharacterized protein n=1 Tax=Elysia crispata TaxID=231223 RepID=A0AAE1AIU8_9GAST|nr:hypothetical protein RRG08_007609 [Elysia crispata]
MSSQEEEGNCPNIGKLFRSQDPTAPFLKPQYRIVQLLILTAARAIVQQSPVLQDAFLLLSGQASRLHLQVAHMPKLLVQKQTRGHCENKESWQTTQCGKKN